MTLKIRLANPIDIRQTQEDNLLGVTLATVPGIEAGMFDQEVFDGSTGQRGEAAALSRSMQESGSCTTGYAR
jgi:hypothetical protein